MVESNELKLFDKYTYSDVVVEDISLKDHITIGDKTSYPHTASDLSSRRFGKDKIPITERFVCGLMRKGRNNGKKRLAIKAVRDAFLIINTMTGKNPLQVLIQAIINSGPREDCARIGKGGAMKRTSVDVSPLRRLNVAIFLLCKGIRQKSMKNIRSVAEVIADEVISAYRSSPNSFAVKKKDEIERMANCFAACSLCIYYHGATQALVTCLFGRSPPVYEFSGYYCGCTM